MAFKLRTYQEEGIKACLEILRSKKKCREVVIAPTGGGKSIYLAEAAKQLDEPLLILQTSRELLKQNYQKSFQEIKEQEMDEEFTAKEP